MPTIDMQATGNNIRNMIKANNMKIADIQGVFGFNTPQAIFKWMRGDAMPTIDNMVILADVFGVTVNDILIIKRI